MLVEHLTGRDRGREPLQVERPAVTKRERLFAHEQARDQGATEDLPTVGVIAEPAGDHDRRAEVVALLALHLADVQADADREPLARGAPTRRLLHRDRAAHGVGGRGEHRHQAIAEPLHLLAAMRGHTALEQSVVRSEDALRLLVAGAREQLGGVHEIGEQQGHRTRGQRCLSRDPTRAVGLDRAGRRRGMNTKFNGPSPTT